MRLEEMQEDPTEQVVQKAALIKELQEPRTLEITEVQRHPNLKKQYSNPKSPLRRDGHLEGFLDLVRMNDLNFGLRIAPL